MLFYGLLFWIISLFIKDEGKKKSFNKFCLIFFGVYIFLGVYTFLASI